LLATDVWKARRTFLPAAVFALKAAAVTPGSVTVALTTWIVVVPGGEGAALDAEAYAEDLEAYAEDFPEAYAEVDPEL
jgi:hypothetical protein